MPSSREHAPDLSPGTVIPVDSMRAIHKLEVPIATFVDPYHDEDLWSVRTPIVGMLKPPGFVGNLVDIRLTVLQEPQRLLEEACEQDVRFINRTGDVLHGKKNVMRDLELNHPPLGILGLHFVAQARSTRKRDMGLVETRIWYGALTKERPTTTGDALVVIAEVHKYDKELFRQQNEDARRQGATVNQGVASTERSWPGKP